MNDIPTEVLYGNLELKIKPPIITIRAIKRKWWFDKIEYWVEWEHVALGPYKSHAAAKLIMSMACH